MQEEVQQKTITMSTQAAKFTAREMKQMIEKFLTFEKTKHSNSVRPAGRQSVKQLAKQNEGMKNIEIAHKTVGDFDRVARKYGIDYAIKRDRTVDPPKYLVFFKAKDNDALEAAFNDYTKKVVGKQKKKESIMETLNKFKAVVKELPTKVKHRELDR